LGHLDEHPFQLASRGFWDEILDGEEVVDKIEEVGLVVDA
jgi:hypothetical protein